MILTKETEKNIFPNKSPILQEWGSKMFSITLPYDSGTFVKIVNQAFERKQTLNIGTVSGYTVFSPTDFTVFVSGYKEPWCGEYLPSEIVPLTEEEIKHQKKAYSSPSS